MRFSHTIRRLVTWPGVRLFSCLIFGLLGWLIFQNRNGSSHILVSAAQSSPDGIWLPLAHDGLSSKPINVAAGRRFHSVSLQPHALLRQLIQAPMENAKGVRPIISLPLPDGSFGRFAIEESPNMEPALAARFPEIKSYRAVSVTDSAVIARFTWSPRGLRALIARPETAYSVEPVSDTQYVSYEDKDAVAPGKFDCLVEEVPELQQLQSQKVVRDLSVANVGPTRRTYRLAMATTYEYTMATSLGGGNKPSAVASVNEWINAVNLIYERDLSAHFNLIANNDQLIYDTASDPFTNGNASTMLSEVRTHLKNTIGAANFDVGHVLGTGSSGVAYLSVACLYDDYKGGGVSLIPSSVSVGHTFYIGRIAHELGHQFGSNHTFNDNDSAYGCASNRAAASAYESGSGYTIMAYSGSCNAISYVRALHFHSGAVNAIANFMQNQATCATTAATGNRPPTVNGGADYTIPKSTPFALTAQANDPDNGDNANLTYSWEQYDAGGTSYGNPAFTDDGDPATTTRPIFRPFSPVTSPTRLFPELFLIQDYNNEPPLKTFDGLYVAQHLPRVSRNLNFKVIVRDQRGGVADDDVLLKVDGNSGPLEVTAPNTAVRWVGGTQQTVTWLVNNTNNAPVSCTQVKIALSLDNGETFPITILGATPNDGSEIITVPAGLSAVEARIKVEAVNNIFFDMGDASFTLEPGTASCPSVTSMTPTSAVTGATVNLVGTNFNGVTGVIFSNNVNATFTVVSNTQINATVPANVVAGPITLVKSGCSNVQTPTFTPVACSYSLSSTSANVGAGIQAASVNVIAITGCAWTSTSNANWITISSGASGSGNGTVNLSVAANTSAARTGTVTIAGQTFTINQASGCTISLSSASANVAATSNTGSFNVTTATGCTWTATSDQSWVTITSGGSGNGNGTVSYSVAANTGTTRTATITISDKTFTVTQASGCNITLSATSANVAATASTGSFNVTAGTGCTWTAISNQTWLTITSGASGTSNSAVNYSVAANTGISRTATITVGTKTFTVTQASGCTVILSTTSANVAATSSTGSFNVTAGTGCTWTASSNQTWLTITNGGSGTSNGTVSYSVSANTGASRSASVTVSGQTFTVTQAGGCTITLNTTSANVAAGSSTGSLNVTAGTGCTWTATSNQTWLTITGGTSGTGNGTVNYSVAANTGISRTATITVGDKTFTLTQVSGCTITLSASTANLAATASTSSFNVTAGTGCTWTAASNQTWLTITSGASGTSNGTVNYSVAANTGASRTATITVGTRTFTVTQASGCTITLSATSANAAATISTGSLNVTAGTGCTWTAVSNQTWLTITSGASGTSNGTVSYSVAANTGASRIATITVSGKTFTVTQAGGCTIALGTSSASVAATSSTGSLGVTAGTGCTWAATSDQTWLTITSGASGTGNGTVSYSVAANTGISRTATITVGDKTFTLTQASGCTITLSTTTANVTAASATGSFNVTTGSGCAWTAVSNQSWLVVTSGGSGTSNGAVNYNVASNTGTTRTATITVGTKTFTVTQASGCTITLSAASATVAALSSIGTFNVTAGTGCTWTATSNQSWLTITSGASGNSNGTVNYSVAANMGTARTATITVGDKAYTVTQASGCSITLSTSSLNVVAGGGTGSFNVMTGTGCTWTAASDQSWVTITSGASGASNSTVNFSVAANTGITRTATITVGDQIFAITQASGCAITLSASNVNVAAASSTGSFNVNSGSGCAWTAISNQAWLTINSGASGTGNGTVNYSVAANTGVSRTATITAGSKTFTVTQANGCTYTLNASEANVVATASNQSVNVIAGAGCTWTATSQVAWLTITSGASGIGNGTATFSVAANTGPARTGTLTVAGKTFTVTQASGCTITLATTSANVAAAGGSGSFGVTSGTGCAWAANSDQTWLVITSGASGTGNGTVGFTAQPNTGATRAATIAVGDKTFTVTQAGGCTITLNSAGANVAVAGGTGSVNVTAGAGCTWTATSNAVWLVITSGANGNGNGVVNYSVAVNTGAARTANLTVGDKTFTVTQASGCTFGLSATSVTVVAAATSTQSVNVTAGTGCVWTAVSNANWLTITNGANGSGNGLVSFAVIANTGPQRTGTLTIAGQTFTVMQNGGCAYSLSATNVNVAAGATTGNFNVMAGAGCTWAAVSNQSWLTVTSGANGSGNGTINFAMAANSTGAQRTAMINVAGLNFTVTQAAGCIYSVTLSSQKLLSASGSIEATVTAGAGCLWTATSNQSWATIQSGASGTGNGIVIIRFTANTAPDSRQAMLTIAGSSFVITQEPACSVTLASDSVRVGPNAGTVTVTVSTNPSGCVFVAFPDQDSSKWVSIPNPVSSPVTINFLENNGFERTSKITIGNKTFTLVQEAKPVNCSGAYFSPTSHSAAYTGGTYQVEVSTGFDCRWEATTSTPWIVLEPGTTRGIRRGTLTYKLATNPTAQSRTGTIQVNGKSFTVTQAAAPVCSFNVTPTTANVVANGGTTTLNVSASTGCSWSAISTTDAAKINTGSNGTGNGVVTVVTQPNVGASTRTIKLLVAGQTVTLTQAGGATSNPTPSLIGLSLKERTVTNKLSVFGHNFLPNSVVRWNSADHVTTFISSTELEVSLTLSEYSSSSIVQVNVFNPAAAAGTGGGLSNTVNYRAPWSVVGVSAAAYNSVEGVAPDSIVAIFGNEMATGTAAARTVPLPNTLVGTTVRIYDRDGRRYQLPLFFASPYQINAMIPSDIAPGIAELAVICSDGTMRTGYIEIQKVSPGYFTIDASGQGASAGQALRLSNGVLTYEDIARYNTTTLRGETIPIDLGPETDKVYLVLYATGLRSRTDLSKVAIRAVLADFSEIPLTPLYAGTQGSFVGLDQLNLEIPRSLLGKGKVYLRTTVDGWASNQVEVNIK